MFVEDPNWKGPRCRMCTAPVKDPRMHEEQEKLWGKLKEKDSNATAPPYFCSHDCAYAKYMG